LLIKKKSNIPTKARKPAVNIFLKAKHYQKLIKQGVVKNKSELAKKEGVSRARITQILNLLKLAPEIQIYFANLIEQDQQRFFTERRLRQIVRIKAHKTQMKKFQELKRNVNFGNFSLEKSKL
jgi:hypothetical protein